MMDVDGKKTMMVVICIVVGADKEEICFYVINVPQHFVRGSSTTTFFNRNLGRAI